VYMGKSGGRTLREAWGGEMAGFVEASSGAQASIAGAGRKDCLGGLPWCPLFALSMPFRASLAPINDVQKLLRAPDVPHSFGGN
jgi:hypothetical protein